MNQCKWRPVIGYEGLYEVSNSGIVRNAKTKSILKHAFSYNGYHRVALYKNSKKKMLMVHRIVAQSFIGLPEANDLQINHKDGNKDNNCVENLEWCTQSENLSHSFRIGLRDYNKQRLLEKNRKAVMQMDTSGTIIKKWDSMSEAARELNLSVSNICNCCSGRIRSVGGFKWERCSDF